MPHKIIMKNVRPRMVLFARSLEFPWGFVLILRGLRAMCEILSVTKKRAATFCSPPVYHILLGIQDRYSTNPPALASIA